MCAHITDDKNQKSFPGNTTMKDLPEWFEAGNKNELAEEWEPINALRIKDIKEGVLTIETQRGKL